MERKQNHAFLLNISIKVTLKKPQIQLETVSLLWQIYWI